MNIVNILLILLVAFLAGVEGILDEFQFHQPIIACTLIGLVSGEVQAGILLGGCLQMITLGWANIGAAVAPDVALASIASSLFMVISGQGVDAVYLAIAIAIPLAMLGTTLTNIVRKMTINLVHHMDEEAEKANPKGIAKWHMLAVCLQGLRVMIPAAIILCIPSAWIASFVEWLPAWFMESMKIAAGLVVAVGYGIVMNVLGTKEMIPFFIMGFVFAMISELSLFALGCMAFAIAIVYLYLSEKGSSSSSDDPLGDILEDY